MEWTFSLFICVSECQGGDVTLKMKGTGVSSHRIECNGSGTSLTFRARSLGIEVDDMYLMHTEPNPTYSWANTWVNSKRRVNFLMNEQTNGQMNDDDDDDDDGGGGGA